ncbi:unnamed protein product [Acanthoscelides obtectus]|uniref:Uncharacterized protein n=1 Tax=Acanthoscelides obtectus TaxID=200917 RepID=A0A9P0LWZ0_ACAOB|nr:unnamed protein product [Acanthoscelides obtectus]CAK1620902.1 hypothetical protein AOBTE_LOCUS645 [Acanthoscelides obtectus]
MRSADGRLSEPSRQHDGQLHSWPLAGRGLSGVPSLGAVHHVRHPGARDPARGGRLRYLATKRVHQVARRRLPDTDGRWRADRRVVCGAVQRSLHVSRSEKFLDNALYSRHFPPHRISDSAARPFERRRPQRVLQTNRSFNTRHHRHGARSERL